MKYQHYAWIIAFFVLLTAFNLLTEWKPTNPTDAVTFKAKGITGTTDGKISGLKGKITFDATDPKNSVFDVTLEVKTLFTDNTKRDKHLKSADYFDAEKYPLIKFRSSSVLKLASGGYEMVGNLTIKQTTKTITFPFTFTENGSTGLFKGSFQINRLDYGIGESSWMLKNDVLVEIATQVSK